MSAAELAVSFMWVVVLCSVVVLTACDADQPATAPAAVKSDQPTTAPMENIDSTDLDEPMPAENRLLIIGDSLSAAYNMPVQQGWVALLEKRLEERDLGLDVVNASISGDTTAGALARLSPLLNQYQPDLLMIELGGNDGLRGLAPENMRSNLSEMIEQSRSAGAKVILVGVKIPLNYGPQYRQAFEKVYSDLATEFGIPLVPFPLEEIVTQTGYLQVDGVHPTAEAQPLILDAFWPGIESAYQELEDEA